MRLKWTDETVLKQVILVRTDLEMRKGKVASQVAHAAVNPIDKRVILKVGSLAELEAYERKAQAAALITRKIADAGHTQVDPGTVTVLSIIGPESIVNDITGELKLL